jgi:hypothetical protein
MPDLPHGHSVINVEVNSPSKVIWLSGDEGEYAKQGAVDRLPEIVEELKRRAFHGVMLAHDRIEATIGAFSVMVIPNTNRDRPYIIRAGLDATEMWITLLPGREVTFEGALQVADDLLAGFKAGKYSSGGYPL